VANWPLVFYERGSSDWTLTHGLFRRAGLVPNVALEVDTIETAKRMVDRGLGMAFLPQLAVGQELRSESWRLSNFSTRNLSAEASTSFTRVTARCEKRRRHFSM